MTLQLSTGGGGRDLSGGGVGGRCHCPGGHHRDRSESHQGEHAAGHHQSEPPPWRPRRRCARGTATTGHCGGRRQRRPARRHRRAELGKATAHGRTVGIAEPPDERRDQFAMQRRLAARTSFTSSPRRPGTSPGCSPPPSRRRRARPGAIRPPSAGDEPSRTASIPGARERPRSRGRASNWRRSR